MNDTSSEIDAVLKRLIAQKTGEERLLMGCSMYDTAKQIVICSILKNQPDMGEDQLKRNLFFRFYGDCFSTTTSNKILKQLI